ncbi:flavoprotein [Nocardia sp. NPDC051570]|uniref:flavoprotein n=1 Tax=Nocardia sp. NPDC051570 TaxID=3364324 RepID=UPI0037AF5C1B
MDDHGQPVLYAIVTGSPIAGDVGTLVDLAQADGWDVCVVASPYGRRFIDAEALEARTGYPVRSEYKDPGTPDVLPLPDAIAVAPLTCNSLAKWAAGISDTLPLGLVVEGVGKRLPVVAVPASNSAQISFPAIQNAMRNLADWGVTILGEDVYPQPVPKTGGSRHLFPWPLVWRAVLAHPWLTIGGSNG